MLSDQIFPDPLISERSSRYQSLIGALVADAATMGLHWMYDQGHIETISKSGDVLFRQPDANNYKNRKSYFAHAAKSVGQNSQYGECVRVVAQVIRADGQYSTSAHRDFFLQTFGPCGSYHGFADRPTKALVAKIILEGDDIADASGSDDDQLPALCSIPALFAYDQGSDSVEKAVSVTSINTEAIGGARALYNCLQRLHDGEGLAEALTASASCAEPALSKLLIEALSKSTYDPLGVANHFGMPCHIKQGLPVAWHILKHASDFESAVRDNIRCGGDSCGRSMAVGSVAAFVFGVPNEMEVMLSSGAA